MNEYKIVGSPHGEELEKQINALSKQGWKAISIATDSRGIFVLLEKPRKK